MPIISQQRLENFLLPPGTQISNPGLAIPAVHLVEVISDFIIQAQAQITGTNLDNSATIPSVTQIKTELEYLIQSCEDVVMRYEEALNAANQKVKVLEEEQERVKEVIAAFSDLLKK
jgi:hypothetical protein